MLPCGADEMRVREMMPVIAMLDLDLRDQRVPMRLDLNVPLADGVSIVLSGGDLEPSGGKTAMFRPRNPR